MQIKYLFTIKAIKRYGYMLNGENGFFLILLCCENPVDHDIKKHINVDDHHLGQDFSLETYELILLSIYNMSNQL